MISNTLHDLELSCSSVKKIFSCTIHTKTKLEEEFAANLHFRNFSFKHRQFLASLENFSFQINKYILFDFNILNQTFHFNPSQNTHIHKFILPCGQILIPLLNNTKSHLSI